MGNITTYAVDHGTKSPSVSANMIVNGGQVIAVSFGDSLKRLDEAEAIIQASIHRLKQLDPLFDEDAFIKQAFEEYLHDDEED